MKFETLKNIKNPEIKRKKIKQFPAQYCKNHTLAKLIRCNKNGCTISDRITLLFCMQKFAVCSFPSIFIITLQMFSMIIRFVNTSNLHSISMSNITNSIYNCCLI